MSDGVIAAKPLLGYTIAKEATEMSTRLELCSFMRRKRTKQAQQKTQRDE